MILLLEGKISVLQCTISVLRLLGAGIGRAILEPSEPDVHDVASRVGTCALNGCANCKRGNLLCFVVDGGNLTGAASSMVVSEGD
jgi:hypothetical protein